MESRGNSFTTCVFCTVKFVWAFFPLFFFFFFSFLFCGILRIEKNLKLQISMLARTYVSLFTRISRAQLSRHINDFSTSLKVGQFLVLYSRIVPLYVDVVRF